VIGYPDDEVARAFRERTHRDLRQRHRADAWEDVLGGLIDPGEWESDTAVLLEVLAEVAFGAAGAGDGVHGKVIAGDLVSESGGAVTIDRHLLVVGSLQLAGTLVMPRAHTVLVVARGIEVGVLQLHGAHVLCAGDLVARGLLDSRGYSTIRCGRLIAGTVDVEPSDELVDHRGRPLLRS
jgi:hypothetical protein